MNSRQIPLYWGFALGGIDWMTRAELAEAIPPAVHIFDYVRLSYLLEDFPCLRYEIRMLTIFPVISAL
mgnify:CR=1 FL=1